MDLPKPAPSPVQLWGIKDELGTIVALVDDSGKTIPLSDIASQGVAIITGQRKYGHTLTAKGARGYSFTAGQWTRNGANISGATGLTYLQTDADVDANISFIPTNPSYASPAGKCDPDAPGAPTVSGTVANKKISFTITPSSYTGGAPILESIVDTYDVDSNFKVASVNIVGSGITGEVTKNITTGKKYALKARQRNRAGWSSDSTFSAIISDEGSATKPITPVAPVLTALANAISVAYTVPANGGSAITQAEFLGSDGVVTQLTGSPQTISKTAGTAITGATRFRNAVGWSDYSDQSNSVTPTEPVAAAPKLASLNYLNPNISESFTGVSAIRGRTIYRTSSQPTTDGRFIIPRWANGNTGDIASDACTAAYTLEYNGQFQPLKRNGSTTFTLAAGEENVITDAIDWTQFGIMDGRTPVNADLYIRYEEVYSGPSARYSLGSVVAHNAGNSCYGYLPANVTAMSPVNGTGPMTITATGLNTRTRGASFMLIGRPVDPSTYKALGLFGASQARGGTDPLDTAVTVSGSGWLRACVGATRNIAGGKCATAGNTLTNMTGTNNKTHWFFQYITDLVLDIGGNDLGALNGSTDRTKYASVQKDILLLVAVIRAASPGIRVIGLPKPPCIVSSVDNFATIENQVAGTEWGLTNGTSGTTTGRGQLFRIWMNEQVNTTVPGTFTGVITNTQMAVTGVDPAKRRPAIGDVITATGYVGTITSISANADQDGNGTYSVSPAQPSGLSSRAYTCAVESGKGFDFVLKVPTYPGRDDLWALASDTSWGLAGGAAIGVPAGSEAAGYNHQLANQYEASSKKYLGPYLGMTY